MSLLSQVLSGGSAGAIVAFEAGHSDSGDPESFLTATTDKQHNWEYVRVPGLNLFPGLCCPHYDKIQSNGVLRATDFDSMMKRHPGERGIGIDHWAALKVEGENYQVLSPQDKEGSVLSDGTFSSDRKGTPGVWILECVGENNTCIVQRQLAPASGLVSELFRSATTVSEDLRLDSIRTQNPAAFEKDVKK